MKESVLETFGRITTTMGQFIRPKDGVVATYGVGKVMWLVQNGDQDGASRLTGLVKEFYDVKKMSPPLVDKKKRDDGKVYFSDWDAQFEYMDRSGGVPREFHSLSFTPQMKSEKLVVVL